uniref:Uncharacterized protein n=1 Tax=Salix viminalis TaxID=40686 RepID=A0A6N2MMD9_SALVM
MCVIRFLLRKNFTAHFHLLEVEESLKGPSKIFSPFLSSGFWTPPIKFRQILSSSIPCEHVLSTERDGEEDFFVD